MEDKDPRLVSNIKRYALWLGGGACTALQLLRTDFLTFPPDWKIYLSFFFSFVAIFSVFFAGSVVMSYLKKWTQDIKYLQNKIKEGKREEEDNA